MKNKVSLSKLVTTLAFVFVFIFSIFGTNAWLTDFDDDSTKSGFAVVIGEVDALILGNKTLDSTIYDFDLSANGFELPSMLIPGESFNQHINVKNNEICPENQDPDNYLIYTRVKIIVRCSGADVSDQGYITTNTTWTYDSSTGWYTYNNAIAAQGTVGFCTSMTVSNTEQLPQGGVFQVVIVMEGASSLDRFN